MFRVVILVLMSFLLLGCKMESNKNETVEQKVLLNESTREVISGLESPVVDYTLLKDGEDYADVLDIPLVESGGTYAISLTLVSGSSYVFSKFTIKTATNTEYILDAGVEGNTTGFSISVDGVLSTPPKIYLKRVTGIIFESLEYDTLSVDVITDESSFLEPVSLTFKVSSNVPNAVFHVYKYTRYWISGPTLEQNQIYDMDTGNIFDPMVEGDEDPWGNGKFKIVTTNTTGETVFVVGLTEEWSKKHVHLVLN